ncbi:hypothetical protein [Halegenticoccus tardaugens]|uniref:hypothetical protein n=1 Tax=Halegenticoccus tardaugens TaxID=2071624 RepID=UPI00100ADA5D|nr:hypothetical protein [Halegenticoccus tardaugens]
MFEPRQTRREALKGIALGGLTAVGVGSSAVSAQSGNGSQTGDDSQPVIVDDFEDGDLNEYEFDRGRSGAEVVTDQAYRGSNALAITGTDTELTSTTGLDPYPRAGDTFTCWFRASGGADTLQFSYGVQSPGDRYYVKVNYPNEAIQLYRVRNTGSPTRYGAANRGFTLAKDRWYGLVITWHEDGRQIVRLYDEGGNKLTQFAGRDNTWKRGGIGYDAYLESGGTAYFDYVTITSPPKDGNGGNGGMNGNGGNGGNGNGGMNGNGGNGGMHGGGNGGNGGMNGNGEQG